MNYKGIKYGLKNTRKGFILFLVFAFFSGPVSAQKKLEKEKNRILGEGMALYTLILANWMSNDLYYENEFNTNIVKGYLSYRDKDTIKTIFWRELDTASAEYKAKMFRNVGDTGVLATKKAPPLEDTRFIIKQIAYRNMSVKKSNAVIADMEERTPNPTEKLLMDYREMVYKEVAKDTSFFKRYAGTVLRAVPLDAGKEMRIYLYSTVKQDGIVPIGGDYLMVYDKKTKELLEKTDLHKDCIFISGKYKGKASDASKATIHEHKSGAAELITPTDIAALLLYKNQLEWDEHHVIAGEYTCVFTMVDRKLTIMTTEEFNFIRKKKAELDKESKKENMR